MAMTSAHRFQQKYYQKIKMISYRHKLQFPVSCSQCLELRLHMSLAIHPESRSSSYAPSPSHHRLRSPNWSLFRCGSPFPRCQIYNISDEFLCFNRNPSNTHNILTSGSGKMFKTLHCKLTISLGSSILYERSIESSGSVGGENQFFRTCSTTIQNFTDDLHFC